MDNYAHNDGGHNEIEDIDDDEIALMSLVDEDHRGGFVDSHLRPSLPEAVLVDRRHSHRHLPH